KYKNEIIEALTETLFYGLVIVDENGIITHLNENYCRFLQVNQSEAVGMHVTEVIENTRMHHVLNTGKAEMFHPQFIRNNYMIDNSTPLKLDGIIIGVVGVVLFRDMNVLFNLFSVIIHLLSDI